MAVSGITWFLIYQESSLVIRAAAVLLPLLWLSSSLNLRWREAHAKDDYRTAAAIAAGALRDNKEVWWAADAAAAFIYLTPVALEDVPGRAWATTGLSVPLLHPGTGAMWRLRRCA